MWSPHVSFFFNLRPPPPPLRHALRISAPTLLPGGLLPVAGLVSPGKPRLASRGQATAAPSGRPADAAAEPWGGHIAAAVAPSCGQGLIP